MINQRRADLEKRLGIFGGELAPQHAPSEHVTNLRVDQMRRMACLGGESAAQRICCRGLRRESDDKPGRVDDDGQWRALGSAPFSRQILGD